MGGDTILGDNEDAVLEGIFGGKSDKLVAVFA